MNASPSSHKRPAMVASVIREVIAPVLRECPPDCGIVSITRVEVSADYSYVTVYIGALRNADAARVFLEERRGRLQGLLGKKVSLRRTPVLRIRIDRQAEEGDRIDQLLRNADPTLPNSKREEHGE